MKKVVLITGASSGFGKLTASKLLKDGDWTVYAAARRVEKMQDLVENGAKILEVDVSNDTSVESSVDLLMQREGQIDALIANAGYGSYGMIEAVPMKEIEYQYNVNVFGVARCLKAVLPHMRKQRSGRIVITESVVSHMSTLGLGWYASTKHALRGMSIALRQEVKDFGISVVAIEPGGVDTEFDEVAFEKLKNVEHPEDYENLVNDFHAYMLDAYRKAPNADSTADAMVDALNDKKPKFVYKTTSDAKFAPAIISMVPDATYDKFILKSIKEAGERENGQN